MKRKQKPKCYGYDLNASHSWAIFVVGSKADPAKSKEPIGAGDDYGGVIGTSEWIWLDQDMAERICTLLTLAEGIPTNELLVHRKET